MPRRGGELGARGDPAAFFSFPTHIEACMRDRIGPTRSQPASCRPRGHARRGFSLVEALAALVILGMTASALLLATQTSASANRDALQRTVAAGLAQQYLDEILGLPYHEPGATPQDWPLGPEPGEVVVPARRALFDDIDDFHAYSAMPPRDPWGLPLGHGDGAAGSRYASLRASQTFLADWRVDIAVRYANPDDPSVDLAPGATSLLRSIEVTISRIDAETTIVLAKVRRVIGYVPAV